MAKVESKTKKILNIILDILIGILGLFLLITIYNNIQVNLMGNDYSSFFGYSIFEVQTGSMGDAIHAGDWIIVKKNQNPKLNDIVTFENKDEFITHRVIESYNGTYVTKGDANNAKDSPINKDQIVGTVEHILPHFGILRKTLFNPFVLLGLIVTLYLINSIMKTSPEEDLKFNERLKKYLSKKKDNFIEQFKEEDNTPSEKEKLEAVVEEVEDSSSEEIEEEDTEEEDDDESDEEDEEEVEEIEETEEEPEILEPVVMNKEDDMESTVYFRMVEVDGEEIEEAFKKPVEDVVELPPVEEEVEEEIKEDEVKLTLELIQKKKKKSKNFIDKIMYIKEEELNEIMMILNKNEKYKTNEPSIKDTFIKSYIDGKYYNYCGNVNVEYNGKNMNLRLEHEFNEIEKDLIKKYKGKDTTYKEKVTKFKNLITLINYIEEDFISNMELSKKKESYNKRILKYVNYNDLSQKDIQKMITNIMKLERKYRGVVNFLLNKLDTGMFNLHMEKLGKEELYATNLEHNIKFSEVYSDYIVDKTYTEGVIAEDKIEILASLLLSQLVKNMLSKDFKKKYIIYIPESLYDKETKLLKIFKLFDDEFAKENILVLIGIENFTKNKKVISKLIKEGYKFATDLNNVEELKKREQVNLHLMTNIFIDKKRAKETNILAILPKEVKDCVVYEDVASLIENS